MEEEKATAMRLDNSCKSAYGLTLQTFKESVIINFNYNQCMR